MSATLLTGCYTGPAATHYVAIADELVIPADWILARAIVRGPDQAEHCDPSVTAACPAAIRSYAVPMRTLDAYERVRAIVTDAGFAVSFESSRDCSAPPSAPPCSFLASRGEDVIFVNVHHSLADAGLAGDSNDAAVVISAQRRG